MKLEGSVLPWELWVLDSLNTRAMSEWDQVRVFTYLGETDKPNWAALEKNIGFDLKWVVFFLSRKRFIPPERVRDIYRTKELLGSYAVNRALVKCRFTPVGIAANVLPLLRWIDLLHALRDPYLSGGLKHRMEQQIMDRFPSMALGEKIVLAKQAPRGLVRRLRLSPDPRTIRALFNNYFFTFDDALFLANYPKITAEVLAELVKCSRWTQHKQMRLDLLANPKLPINAIKPLLRGLTDYDLRRLFAKPDLGQAVRLQIRHLHTGDGQTQWPT